MKKYKLGIVIPTYKERENIEELLNWVYKECCKINLSTKILVMDDNSPDGTADIVKEVAKKLNTENFEITIHVRPGKMGLASAYTQGFAKLKSEVDYLLSMDADLSHKPIYIKDFIQQADAGYDLVIGSRNIKDGGVENWPLFRIMLSKGASLYARVILGVKIHDFTGGYNLYKSEIFDKFNLETVKAQGYLFQIVMKYTIAKMGYKFIEIPIIFPDRTRGHSKISKSIIFEALFGVIKLRFSKR